MKKFDRRRPARKTTKVVTAAPQAATVVERREFVVRLLTTRRVEVFVHAETADVAQELAANGLGRVTNDERMYSEIASVVEIG